MKNRYVGLFVVGIAVLLFLIVISFNNALDTIVATTCTHGALCPMHATVRTQKIISYSLMGLLTVVGLFISFFLKDDLPSKGSLSDEERQKKMSTLQEEEQKIVSLIQEAKGSAYQSDLIKKTGFTKVKVTRVLDTLEGLGLVERQRRGMTNVVLLR